MVMTRAFDAVVVGAGIAGVASAYYLQKADFSVALIDRYHPGWGASGRNPGSLWLQTKSAGLSMDFAKACRRFAGTLPEEFDDFGFRASGGLIIYRDEEYRPIADAFIADRIAAGLTVEYLDRTVLLGLRPNVGPSVSGAVWNPLDAHQDTRLLVRHLVRGFEAAGGAVFVLSRVAAIDASANACRGVTLTNGDVVASPRVIVSAGPWSNDLLAPLGLSIPYKPTRFEAAENRAGTIPAGPRRSGTIPVPILLARRQCREPAKRHDLRTFDRNLASPNRSPAIPMDLCNLAVLTKSAVSWTGPPLRDRQWHVRSPLAIFLR